MHLPSRRARVALLAGCATFAAAAPASAEPSAAIDAAGKLTVTFSGTEAVTMSADDGKVRLAPVKEATTIAVADVKTIEVREDAAGTGANTVDLSAVTAATFPNLTGTLIKAAGGNDTLTGSQLADRIEGGRQDDTMNGRDGDDTLVWNPGEDTDVMNAGDGVDAVIVIGGGADEQFVVKPKAGAPGRVDASRINNPFSLDIGGAEKLTVGGNGGNDTITGSAGLAGLVEAEFTGGDGNDTLTGTDGEDVIAGGPGNDGVFGARGDDDMRGDEGDDLLVWNPGEGSDKMEGGPGNDVAQDNGGAAAEHFIVSANGARVTATRDNGAPFFLDIGTAETLDLNTNGGDDAVEVNGGLAALIRVDADLGEGNDAIEARNDSAQVIDGGAGTDRAEVDGTDQVANVETVDDALGPEVAIASKQLRVRKGKALVKLTCPAGDSCTGRLRLVRDGKVLGTAKLALAGGQAKTHKVALTRRARRALADADGGRLRVTLKVTAEDAAGNAAKVAQRLALKR